MAQICTNASFDDIATSLLCVQNHYTPNELRNIATVMTNLSKQIPKTSSAAFELLEVYLHANDKQSFCRLFAVLTGTTWTSFVEQLMWAVSDKPDWKTKPKQEDLVSQEKWDDQDQQNFMMLIGTNGKCTGELSRRLNYIVKMAKIEKMILARCADIGRTTLYRYMLSPTDARFAVPNAKTLKRILHALPVSASAFCAYPESFDTWKQQF